MKLVYDARLTSEPYSGLGRFTGALLGALLAGHPWDRNQLVVLVPAEPKSSQNPYLDGLREQAGRNRNLRILAIRSAGISLEQHFSVPRLVDRLAADSYFYPHFDAPLPSVTPLSFVVHDLQPLLVKDYVQRAAWLKKAYFRWRLNRNLRGADRCFAVSAQTKSDLCNSFGMKYESKIRVCWEGDYLQNLRPDPQERIRLGIHSPYMLYVGSRRPNKNLPYTIEVVREMRAAHGYPGDLVIVGSEENYGFNLDRHVQGLPWVRLLRGCDDRKLAALYEGADGLILLSQYEGFGLPVIEASRFGLPLILSDGGALPEIAPADACILPLSLSAPEAAREAAQYLRLAPKQKQRASPKKFDWQETARACFPEVLGSECDQGSLPNYDYATIHSFGREWQRFAQNPLEEGELASLGQNYFRLLPDRYLGGQMTACDFGCGSGRWAKLIAPRVKVLHCLDASLEVLRVARRNLVHHNNVRFHCCSIEDLMLADGMLDFAYCLGVLHHLPDPEAGLHACVKKLRPGAPMLIYIYQKIPLRPFWRHLFFRCVDLLRRGISRLPGRYLDLACDLLALFVYLPLARVARWGERMGLSWQYFPLAFYRHSSFYTMRTDARDRFGTPLEKRYNREEIAAMMRRSGLENIQFNSSAPFWTAVGYRAAKA